MKEFAMGQFGIPELMILVVLAAFWLVPVAAGIWAVLTLHRLRAGQLEVLTKLGRIERHLPQI
jgi:hypothetical protein